MEIYFSFPCKDGGYARCSIEWENNPLPVVGDEYVIAADNRPLRVVSIDSTRAPIEVVLKRI